ncbi:PREDICTED: uncharacterized protein LOC109476717 [Branchiostoma belcheri]|uniref:Uncharacterized protein LOC109476717 n=1 Tax=Branchiostoma belcheri TaxID=7741 RepID=A0A6P4ZGZ6_BRABE|nr:PREDICTED: uncharacterized protein LOC109476717 [Branchiostoma belcheri]
MEDLPEDGDQEDGADMQEDGADMQEDGADMQEDGADMQEYGADMQEDGADMQEDGADMQEDGADMQEDGADMQEDGADMQDGDGRNKRKAREGGKEGQGGKTSQSGKKGTSTTPAAAKTSVYQQQGTTPAAKSVYQQQGTTPAAKSSVYQQQGTTPAAKSVYQQQGTTPAAKSVYQQQGTTPAAKTLQQEQGTTRAPSGLHTLQEKVADKRQKQPTDYGKRLPKGWEKNVRPEDRQWLGKTLFVKPGQLSPTLQHWYHPPLKKADGQTKPQPELYFLRRMFLWMPRRMYLFDFRCPNCPKRALTGKGTYNRVRLVLDTTDYYYLCTEYLTCSDCGGTFPAWDSRLLHQLPDHLKMKFPALLTRKYACDRNVVALLRSRTLGNSSTALRNTVMEMHSEEWLRKQVYYLSACKEHRKRLGSFGLEEFGYDEAPSFPPFPQPRWFLATYVRGIYMRLPALKAALTSTFGNILKIDSTKKVCRKLQGESAGTAEWSTNIGNERGQVLQSVLTTTEGKDALEAMASGLMKRYRDAGQDPPVLLYTDRDCCAVSGPSRFQLLFSEWEGLEVRLDIWHYMRRIAVGCTSEAHPLYGTFMTQLSSCIFEWSQDDYAKLLHAKEAELIASGIPNPPEGAVKKAITKDELAKHCRRRTRGTESTIEAIEELILSFSTATDTIGVPLFRPEMTDIWTQQKQHVKCIQDPPGVELYTWTGNIKKGGVTVPVFRTGRGTTSLESFHLHLNRFIPGTSASAVNFQAYLVEGMTR